MTLIELMIIIVLLGILAALVVPLYKAVGDSPRVEVLATNIRAVQSVINQKRSAGAYPATIAPGWFNGGMPQHTFSNRAMVIGVVTEPTDVIYPATKTFNPDLVGADSAWYNTTNGVFRALVPVAASDAETLAMFNDVNKTSATVLNQTTD
jgi:type II secretory pathway pseudopilin PulG